MQGLAARGGAHRGVVDDDGARPESARERGLLVGGGGGSGAGSVGEARALERRGQRGVEMGGRVEQREQGASCSAAARQRGKEEGKGGGPGVGVPRGAGVPWGLAPTGGRRLAVPRAWRWWVTCAACARAGRTERGREGADEWVTAQCWAAVPLTSGAGLSAGAGARLRGRVWAGPRRNGDRPPGCTVWFLHLFELV
jgi:hypothetical protein